LAIKKDVNPIAPRLTTRDNIREVPLIIFDKALLFSFSRGNERMAAEAGMNDARSMDLKRPV
jgi:hypothetical protein